MYIIFDLDETILNYNHEIDDFTLCTIRYFQNKGHKLVINTARSLKTCLSLIDIIKPDYSILFGGALIVDKNLKPIFKSVFDKKLLNNVIKEIYDISSIISVETISDRYSNNIDTIEKYFDFKNNKFDDEVYKLLFQTTNIPYIKQIRDKYDLNLETYHSLIWHRFVNKNVSKALGIVELLKYTKDSLTDCISFGDDYGDVDMINICGIGVVMKNASDEVKKLVKGHECLNNNDYGVARFLLNLERENKL